MFLLGACFGVGLLGFVFLVLEGRRPGPRTPYRKIRVGIEKPRLLLTPDEEARIMEGRRAVRGD